MSELLSTAEFDESPAFGREESATTLVAPTDGERLMRFVRYRDEAAFAQVVETHAAMVWGVCSQILRHHQDVEDAFQATFLILARKARSIRAADSAAGWICRVAYRTALLAHGRRSRRKETALADEPASFEDQLAEIERNEQSVRLLEELNALPARYREAIVLCYLEGRTRVAAAEQMGLSSQAVKGLLARGTRQLRTRLVRRGIALSTSIAVVNSALTTAQGAVTPSLVASTVAQGATFALKLPLATSGLKGAATTGAAYTLAEKGIIAMAISAASKPIVGVMGVCLAVGMLTVAEARPKLSAGRGSMDVVFVAAAADDGADAGEGDDAEGEAFGGVVVEEQSQDLGEPSPAPLESSSYGEAASPPLVTVQATPVPSNPVVNQTFTYGRGSVPGAEGSPAGEAQAWQFHSVPAVQQIAPTPAQPPAGMMFAQSSAWNPMATTSVAATAGPSAATLRLEQDYWELKAQGLKKKADVLRTKAARARTVSKLGTGAVPETEALELEAEADLTLAEVKLCEMNSQRVKESLPANKLSGELKTGDVGEEVKALQHALNKHRDQRTSALVVDGHFGAQTEYMVRHIQRTHKLTQSGVADRDTLKVLGLLGIPPLGAAQPVTSGMMAPTQSYGSAASVETVPDPFGARAVQVKSAEMTVVPKKVIDELQELAEKNAKLQKQIEELERESESPKK